MFIKDLEQKKGNFRVVNANEMTCREFISSFMNSAVTHVRSKESELQLKAEEWINGSRGYGPVDYSVNLGEDILLVEKAKKILRKESRKISFKCIVLLRNQITFQF